MPEKGWEKLYGALEMVREMHNSISIEEERIKVVQIKEKFGGLRYYVDKAPEWFRELISAIEARSYYVCEVCGERGQRRSNGGWLKTLCVRCAEAKGYGLTDVEKKLKEKGMDVTAACLYRSVEDLGA